MRTRPLRAASALVVAVVVAASAVGCTDDDEGTRPVTGEAPTSRAAEQADTEPVVLCAGASGQEGADEASPADTDAADPLPAGFDHLIPAPTSVRRDEGVFVVDRTVVVEVFDRDAEAAACLLRDELARAAGLRLPVHAIDPTAAADVDGGSPGGSIRFTTAGGSSPDAPAAGAPVPDPSAAAAPTGPAGPTRPEGYRITSTPGGITIEASDAAGHGWAVQTLLQSAAPEVHSPFVAAAPIAFPAGSVTDAPRFAWRGLMIDIARHFFGPTELKRVVDLMAGYKLNILHLHLTDDQGWRLAIEAYPALTEVGAATEVGGGQGGFLSADDYRDLVAYADRRGVTVVPEIDLPGHTNAALVAVPELTCDGVAPAPYTGTRVGFSSLCIGKPEVDTFVRTVLTEVAAMTPGPYLHIGGDEAHSTEPADYEAFVAGAFDVVRELGKVPVGWEEVGDVPGDGPVVAQHWLEASAAETAARNGASLVLSPSSTLYFDMAYGPFAPDGNSWAGTTDTREVYEWDPLGSVAVGPEQVLGVEAPLWTELIETPDEIDLRLLPRLPALAEVAWSDQATRGWDDFRSRLAAHAPRWDAAGRPHVPDPGVPWP